MTNPPIGGMFCTHCLITQPAIPRNTSGATSTHARPGLSEANGSTISTAISHVPVTLVSTLKTDSYAQDDTCPYRACISQGTRDRECRIREGPLVVVARNSEEAAYPEASELRLANNLRAEKSHGSLNTLDHRNENRAEQVL